MKKYILLSIISLFIFKQNIAKDTTNFTIPVGNWNMKILGLDNYHPTYLADPLGIRFEVNAQTIKYGDFDMSDRVNQGEGYLGKLVIVPGVRFSFFKFSPKKNPKLGVEIDLGLTTPVFMRGGNHDVIGVDGIYYIGLAGRPFEWLSLRFIKHHICTHIGDEYPVGGVSSPIDFDPNITLLPVRDDFIFSTAVRPLYFLKDPHWDILQVYGDLGFFWPGVDFLGKRQNKPNRQAYMNFQGGIEAEYYFKKRIFGGLFAAMNVSAYQSDAYSTNTSITAGYIIPQDRDKRRLRLGINFYNGRSLSNQFYHRKEKFVSFILAMDI